MKQNEAIILTIVALACGTASFFIARAVAVAHREPEQTIQQQWLSGAAGEVVEFEESFDGEADELIRTLTEKKQSLALILEDSTVTDDVILERFDDVLLAHENLVKRVGRHIVALRRRLPVDQKYYLMQFCAEAARGPMRKLDSRWGRRGEGVGGGGRGSNGYGQGHDRGRGEGRRGYHRGGGGFGRTLRLSEEQVKAAQEKDPTFDIDTERLGNELMAEWERLISAFENRETGDEELWGRIDRLISAPNRLEKRAAGHVLVLRGQLTVEQQKWLIGVCLRREGDF